MHSKIDALNTKVKDLEINLQTEIKNKETIMEAKDRKSKELEDIALKIKKETNENKRLKASNSQLEEENVAFKVELKALNSQ